MFSLVRFCEVLGTQENRFFILSIFSQVLGNRGNQVLFIEGTVKQDDNIKYPWAKGDFGPLETGASVSYRPPRLFSGAQFSAPDPPVKYNYHPAIETELNAAETIGESDVLQSFRFFCIFVFIKDLFSALDSLIHPQSNCGAIK